MILSTCSQLTVILVDIGIDPHTFCWPFHHLFCIFGDDSSWVAGISVADISLRILNSTHCHSSLKFPGVAIAGIDSVQCFSKGAFSSELEVIYRKFD